MSMLRLSGLALASVVFAQASSAPAATIVTTYTGQVGMATATGTNLFGPSGVQSGTDYILVYTVSDASPAIASQPDAYTQRLDGLGVVTAAITINGITRSIGGSYESHVTAQDGKPNVNSAPTDFYEDSSREFSFVGNVYHDASAQTWFSSYQQDFLQTSDPLAPFNFAPGGTDSVYNYVYFNDFDFNTQQGASIYLNLGMGGARSVSIDSASAAPEPVSWTMMIGGLGIIGAAMRNRPVKGAVSAC